MTDLGAAWATVVYTAAILVLLGVRSWQQYRKTGSAGFNGFRTAKGPAARIAGIGFVLAVLAGMLSPALAWGHVIPLLWGGHPRVIVAGAILALTGLTVGFVAQHTMGTSWRIGVDTSERTDLITHGLFALVRNPIFTALLMIQAGTTLMAPTWVAPIALAALGLACQVQVRLVEEPHLLATHTTRYSRYATRAGRFVPLLGRLQRHDKNTGVHADTPDIHHPRPPRKCTDSTLRPSIRNER
ncbi:MAG: isoprenylcysteine carboxylmethyltransferase family protein [Ornithinimicrobium sp.]